MDEARLEFPDYAGNRMFNTLGNITANAGAGLLFLEFSAGRTLQLTGQARVIWDPERAAAYPGAERLVEYQVIQVIERDAAFPRPFRLIDYSRFNP